MKKLFSIIFCLIFVLLLPIFCFAEDSNVEKFVNNDQILNSNEFNEVKKVAENSNDLIKSDEQFDFKAAYKEYELINYDIVSEYKKGENIESLISDEFNWKIPTTDQNLAVIKKVDNKWEVVAIENKNSSDSKIKSNIINKVSVSKAIIKETSNIKDLKYIKSEMYHTSFSYVKVENGKEFLIPYGSRPDLTGLENGKMYEASEVMDILYINFSIDSGNNNGGIDSSSLKENNTLNYQVIILISIIALIMIFSVSFILIRKCKKNQTK